MTHFDAVEHFRLKIGLTVRTSPSLPSPTEASFQARLLLEEVSEYLQAVEEGDLVKLADSIADLVYVALGTAHVSGLPFEQLFSAVHKANMQKQRGTTKRGGIGHDAVKPAGWVGPEAEIAQLLDK